VNRNARPVTLPHFFRACAAAFTVAALSPVCLGAAGGDHGLDFAGIDGSVAPGDDFFRFANGRWLATTAIPPDRSSWGVGDELDELTLQRTAGLIRAAAASLPPAPQRARSATTTRPTWTPRASSGWVSLRSSPC